MTTEESTIHETKELDFLAKLLDDEDENIYSNVRERFISHGKNTADFLRKFLNDENFLIKKRANEILSAVNYDYTEKELVRIINSESRNFLEDAMLLIASTGYPAIDRNEYSKKLDEMASELNAAIASGLNANPGLSGRDKLSIINKYFFEEQGFKGNTENYYDADNSYLNRVIERKTGIQISLSVLYMLIARRLNLPVYGINLPGHFILKYSDSTEEFFIDPYNGGVIISMKEAAEFAGKAGLKAGEFENIQYLKNAGEKEIILRVMRNLDEVFRKENDSAKSTQIEMLMKKFG
ncbi:MAG: transglutaminase family protein [Ignavibacteria bacterium]|nr:transglutaminase family protein [Ignavibacteria bacterium]